MSESSFAMVEELMKEEKHPCEDVLQVFQEIFLERKTSDNEKLYEDNYYSQTPYYDEYNQLNDLGSGEPLIDSRRKRTFDATMRLQIHKSKTYSQNTSEILTGKAVTEAYAEIDFPSYQQTTDSYMENELVTNGGNHTDETTCEIEMASAKEFQQLMCKYLHYKEECNKTLTETWATLPKNVTYCPGEFDGYICWPHGHPGQVVREACPNYIEWINDSLTSYRYCQEDGSWLKRPTEDGSVEVWNHRTQCNPFTQSTEPYGEFGSIEDEENLLNTLKIVYTVGYAASLACLVVALTLLVFLKKLHNTRNYIHMNLMLSFIIRYVAVLIKDKVLDVQYDTKNSSGDYSDENMALYCDDFDGVSTLMISCRIVITLMHYAIVANYFWLLVEGMYLLLLLVFAMTQYKFFPAFMAFGWGGPWIPVGVWVALRLSLENVGCWEMDDENHVLWVLRAPIILSILANFIIFINIVCILFSKLKANNMSKTDYKYRLARSTLALIPLLGIFYIIFLAVNEDVIGPENVVMKVKLAFEMVFTSIQGALISILYCFINGEVKYEIRKKLNKWRLLHGLPAATPSRKCSTYNSSGGTQVTSLFSAHSADTNHTTTDTTFLTPTDRRDSSIVISRRSTNASGEQLIFQNGGPTQPLINCSNGVGLQMNGIGDVV